MKEIIFRIKEPGDIYTDITMEELEALLDTRVATVVNRMVARGDITIKGSLRAGSGILVVNTQLVGLSGAGPTNVCSTHIG